MTEKRLVIPCKSVFLLLVGDNANAKLGRPKKQKKNNFQSPRPREGSSEREKTYVLAVLAKMSSSI